MPALEDFPSHRLAHAAIKQPVAEVVKLHLEKAVNNVSWESISTSSGPSITGVTKEEVIIALLLANNAAGRPAKLATIF